MSNELLVVIVSLALVYAVARLIGELGLRLFSLLGRQGAKPVAWIRRKSLHARPLRSGRARWPGAFDWLGARFTPQRFSGLPLTVLVIAIAIILALLSGLVESAFESDELLGVDQTLMAWIEPLRTEAVITVFVWLTALGDMQTLISVTIVATIMLAVHGPQRFILPLWICVLGAQASSWLGKYIVDRPRPDFLVDIGVNSPSFPSGHATGSVSVYLLLAYALARGLPGARGRFEVWFWLGAVAATIALSRVVIGVHYPSDIAAGALLGLFWLGVAVLVAELIHQARSQRRDTKRSPSSNTPAPERHGHV